MQVAGLRFFHTSGVYASLSVLNPDGTASPIKPDAKYTIVATDYMLQGGDGFGMFKGAEVLLPAGAPYAQVFIEDLQLFPQGVGGVAGHYWMCLTLLYAVMTAFVDKKKTVRDGRKWALCGVAHHAWDAYGQPCL